MTQDNVTPSGLIAPLPRPDGCPQAFGGCTCDCHRIEGVRHIMPCCYYPTADQSSMAGAAKGGDTNGEHLERAAWMLESYAKHLYTIKLEDIEAHPYIPSIEEAAAELRAMIGVSKGNADSLNLGASQGKEGEHNCGNPRCKGCYTVEEVAAAISDHQASTQEGGERA